MRTIVIGDVHGCPEELDELLALVEYAKGKDRVVFVGDLVDRGPDSVGAVRRARELGAEVVLGNHEEKHLRWRKWERKVAAGEAEKNPMAAFDEEKLAIQAGLSEEDWAWIESWPSFLRLENGWAVLHGGCLPNVPLEKQGKNIIRVRYIDLDTKKFKPSMPGEVPENSAYWSGLWTGPEKVIYGHAVNYGGPKIDLYAAGIDTGCVYGGALTAAVLLPEGPPEFLSILAKRKYSDSPCDE